MDENKEISSETPEPIEPAPESEQAAAPLEATAAQPIVEPKTPFGDRVLGMRGVAAVAAASVILGGAGGAAIGAATGGDDRDQMRPGMINGQFQGGPGGQGGQFDGRDQRDDRQLMPPGTNQLPPTTAPEGEES